MDPIIKYLAIASISFLVLLLGTAGGMIIGKKNPSQASILEAVIAVMTMVGLIVGLISTLVFLGWCVFTALKGGF